MELVTVQGFTKSCNSVGIQSTVVHLAANGPAIKGGCVTRREHRAESWYFSRETVTVQGGYGALFAVRVQILLSITSVAVQG